MEVFIIIILVAIIFSVFWIANGWNKSCYDEGKKTVIRKIFDCFWKPIVSFVGVALCAIILMMIVGLFFKVKIVEKTSTPLYAMNDAFGTEGEVWLGFGTFEQEGCYFYYYKVGKGYKLGKLQADNVLIIEDDNEVPKIQYYTTKAVNEKTKGWIIPNSIDDDKEIVIFVPEGSICQDINFDLKN